MLSRHFILLIASLYLKDVSSSILHNDSYNISNIIANNAGRFQKGLNQITSNRAANLQHSFNSLRGHNSQQNQHPQHALNAPFASPGSGIPSVNQHPGIPTSVNANHAKAIQNRNANNHQLNEPNFGHHNPVQNHQIIQQSPGISSSDLLQNPAILPQMLQNSISDPMLSQALIQELQSLGQPNVNSINDINSIMYQNQQPAYGVPSFILDRPQLASPQYDPSFNGLASQRSEHSSGFGQPEMGNHYAMSNTGMPSHISHLPVGHNNFVNSVPSMASHPTAYASIPASSMSSSPYKQESSSPSLQSLLPLILNLLQDNNDYECCKQCACSNMKNTQQGSQPTIKVNCKDGRYGCKHDISFGKNSISGDVERYNTKNSGSRNGKKQIKVKNIKIEDSYEDYDDDDVGEADYD